MAQTVSVIHDSPGGLSTLPGVSAYALTVDTVGGIRRSSAAFQLAKLQVPWQFIEGCGKSDDSLPDHYAPVRNLFLQKRSLTCGEIAVYVGHRRAWQSFLNSNSEYALIVEDDVGFDDADRMRDVIAALANAPESWDYVKFFDFKPKKIRRKIRIGNVELVSYKYPASGAVAYMINRRTARALLKRKRIFRTIDEDISHPWEFSIRVLSTNPNLAREISADLGGSILEDDRVKNKARKNFIRSLWGNVLQSHKLVRSSLYHRVRGL